MSTFVIEVGGARLTCSLQRSDRRTQGITVHPDSSIAVVAPHGVPLSTIIERVQKKSVWVTKALQNVESYRPRTPERKYESGETHRFLGRHFRLKVVTAGAAGVELTRTHIIVGGVSPSDTETVKECVVQWYRAQARGVLSRYYHESLRHFDGTGTTPPRLLVRQMLKRWGSLSKSHKTIVLNERLIEANPSCIEYVIVHELCHLLHSDHGTLFFNLLAEKMPNWRDRKARLERFML